MSELAAYESTTMNAVAAFYVNYADEQTQTRDPPLVDRIVNRVIDAEYGLTGTAVIQLSQTMPCGISSATARIYTLLSNSGSASVGIASSPTLAPLKRLQFSRMVAQKLLDAGFLKTGADGDTMFGYRDTLTQQFSVDGVEGVDLDKFESTVNTTISDMVSNVKTTGVNASKKLTFNVTKEPETFDRNREEYNVTVYNAKQTKDDRSQTVVKRGLVKITSSESLRTINKFYEDVILPIHTDASV